MITIRRGDMFVEEVDALVNPVNCVGVMGAGVALEFKNRWPVYFQRYREQCDDGFLKPGRISWFNDYWPSGRPVLLINFATKGQWREKSRLPDIEARLMTLAMAMPLLPVASIAVPALGCGLGGLAWEDVKYISLERLGAVPDVDIRIYEPW